MSRGQLFIKWESLLQALQFTEINEYYYVYNT